MDSNELPASSDLDIDLGVIVDLKKGVVDIEFDPESDPEYLGKILGSLVTGQLNEFLVKTVARFLLVHSPSHFESMAEQKSFFEKFTEGWNASSKGGANKGKKGVPIVHSTEVFK